MKRLTKTALLTAAVLSTISFSALIVQAHGGGRFDFDAVDTNSDGFLSRGELSAERAKRFDAMDASKDGMLDAAEMQKNRFGPGGKHGEMGGTDRAKRAFEHMDTDKNGSISPEELAVAMENRKNLMGGHGGKFRKMGQQRFLQRMDANGDGKIQKSELTGGIVDRMMEFMDKDKDNRISRAEMKNGPKMFEKKH